MGSVIVRHRVRGIAIGAALAVMTAGLYAATIGIEPDDYSGDLTGVAPGARLVTVRPNSAGTGLAFHRVLSVNGGSWTPTGTKVFGHDLVGSETAPYHWDNLAGPSGAWRCYAYQECGDFAVFGAYFRSPARTVTIRTTIRGEQALDPVELWAFDTNGTRVLRCSVGGVSNEVLQTGELPPPRHQQQPYPSRSNVCGQVLEKKHCAMWTSAPGDCDYVVEMSVTRLQADIGFVWFGGKLWDNSHANLDALSYQVN